MRLLTTTGRRFASRARPRRTLRPGPWSWPRVGAGRQRRRSPPWPASRWPRCAASGLSRWASACGSPITRAPRPPCPQSKPFDPLRATRSASLRARRAMVDFLFYREARRRGGRDPAGRLEPGGGRPAGTRRGQLPPASELANGRGWGLGAVGAAAVAVAVPAAGGVPAEPGASGPVECVTQRRCRPPVSCGGVAVGARGAPAGASRPIQPRLVVAARSQRTS